MPAKDSTTLDNVFVFVVVLVIVVFVVLSLQPVFFTDLMEPLFRWMGLHDGWLFINDFFSGLFFEYGLLILTLLVFYFWLVIFSRPEKKESKTEKKK